ncbi:MAG: phage tail tape measure protein [candidate division Zixibacteria bacterium]|nr:phage tail tape measure protein [candidate division Zixibacteria bacterium]
MADLAKTVSIIFQGDDRMSQSIQAVDARLSSLGRSIDNAVGPLANLGTAILAADAAILALVGATFTKAIQEAGKFSGAFGEITTLINDTGEPIAEFKQQILDYSVDSVKSIEQINQAIYNAVSAGVDYKDSLAFVNTAEQLSVAGRSDLNDTTKVLVSTLNAYGAQTSEATRYSDIMFTTVRLGQTTMSELSTTLAQVTGLAAGAGIPFETLSAAVAALTVSGLPTSQAITGLKAAISNIIKPTSDAEETAKTLGIQFNSTALQTKGLEGVLWDAWRATGGNIDQMSKLFGSIEGLNSVLVLASDKSGKFKEALTAMESSAGATATAYKKVADEFENLNQRLKNSVTAALISIGEELMPAYGEVANSLAELFKSFKISVDDDVFLPVLKAFKDMGIDVGEIIKGIAKNLPEALKDVDWTDLARALRDVTDGLKSLFGMDAADPKALADSIQRVVDSMTTLADVTRGMLAGFAPFGNAVLKIIDGINSLDSANKSLVGTLASTSMAYRLFGPVVGTVFFLIGQDSQTMSTIVNTSFAAVNNGLNAIKVAVLSLATVFAHASQGMAELLDYIPGLDMSDALVRTSERVKILDELLLDANTDLVFSSEKVADSLFGIDRASESATGNAKKYSDALKKVEDQSGASAEKIDALGNTIDQLPASKDITIVTKADKKSIEEAWGLVIDILPDGSTLITNIGLKTNQDNLDDTKKKIDEVAPEKKEAEIALKLDLEKIKEQSAIVQKSIEWKAKVDIAEIEASAEKMKVIFSTLGEEFKASADVSISLANVLKDMNSSSQSWDLMDLMDREVRLRESLLDSQKSLLDAQAKESSARADAIRQGKALIQIDGTGLAPHLEAFMYEVLHAIQVRANAEGFTALVGA